MPNFKPYVHLEHLEKDVVKDILTQNYVYCTPKMDGANSSIWVDSDGVICTGSRKRELSETNDNANFHHYITTSNDDEVKYLREWLAANPTFIIYGEWLGAEVKGKKLIGAIKDYTEGGFFIFDVFDVAIGDFVDYKNLYEQLHPFYHRMVPIIGEFSKPTIDDIMSCADKTDFNLPAGMRGEGIVIKSIPAYCDVYGNHQIGKIVFEDFHAKKRSGNKVKINSATMEDNFVESFCTDGFLHKTKNKVMLALGIYTWENNSKSIGFFLNTCVDDLMREEFYDYFRKWNDSVDLGRIKNLIKDKARHFLGLI